MVRLVAFLRGVNIRGHHVVRKESLVEMFASLGFQGVETHRQSGNVIFDTQIRDLDKVRTKIESKLRESLGYDVAVFVRTPSQLKILVRQNAMEVAEGDSLLVTMLPDSAALSSLSLPMTIPKSAAEIISASGSEVISLTHGGGEGRLPNPFLESKLKVKATTRNMNVIKEIVEKLG